MSVQQIAIALVERDGSFLVGQRAPDVPLAGLFEFPGGKLIPGESASAAAVRECLEETGIAVEAERVFEVVAHEYAHGRLELHFITCRATSDAEPQGSFRWIPRAELARYEFPEANRRVVERLIAAS